MRIVFVRHGEPDYGQDCLTPEGRKQALAAAERLKDEGIEEIWSSPLGRAYETAQASSEAFGLPIQVLDYMREVTWGSRDGSPVFAGGHPWNIADEMIRQGCDLTRKDWRSHPFFLNNTVTDSVDSVEKGIDGWLESLGYVRDGLLYRCERSDSTQKTVALFSHGGSSCAAIGHMLNLPFPYTCALLHLEFTGVTILRLDRRPGSRTLPCLELANDGRHNHGPSYHRLKDL